MFSITTLLPTPTLKLLMFTSNCLLVNPCENTGFGTLSLLVLHKAI